MTVKDVIAKYQHGEIGYAVPDQEPQLAFDFVTENDITDVRETLRGNHAQSSTELQRRLASRGTHVSNVAISITFFRMIANKCHLYLYQSAAENFQT
jgi:hypothetical protein